jgi:LuxR family maltose regulon positive regulatory protein
VTAFAYRYAFIATGEVLCEQNDLETAADYLSKAIELERPGLFPEDMVDGYVALARVRQAQGDAIRALDAMREAITVGQTLRTPRFLDTLKAWQARLWLSQGNVAAAIDWAQHSGLDADDIPSYDDEDRYVALARVWIAQERLDSGSDCRARALRLLARLLHAAESGGRNSRVIEVLALQALALAAGKSSADALAALERALAIAEPEGFFRIFADEGAPMAELLSKVRGAHQPYAERLLAVIRGQPATSQAEPQTTPPSGARRSEQPLIEPLSEREMEVLRLVAANRSNHEIAQALVISINTVKTHLSRLYGKLNARNRLEAIERATELGLLNTSRR